ncbi:MAG: 4Fe-4S ferredoxin [Thermoplasmata archaeon]|nr:MAG: 4Fe-4S ferredoxin [Thermoplasmata archaeon]
MNEPVPVAEGDCLSQAFVLNRKDLGQLIERLKRTYERVYLPVGDAFREAGSIEGISFTGARALFGPKKYFFPPRESLFGFTKDGNIEDLLKEEKGAVIGARVCDLKALEVLDKYFGELPEPFYLTRKEGTFVAGATCTEPHQSCFCVQFGGLSTEGLKYDLWFTDFGDVILMETGSARGEEVVKDLDLLNAPKELLYRKERIIERVEREQGFRRINDKKIFDWFSEEVTHEIWERLAEECYACGKCNMICPTCHCFDVVDMTDLEGSGERVRIWDACHLFRYGLVASGHNFRGERLARAQYRIYDKFYYPYERYGIFACVGCGRCFEACSADIDLRDVLKVAGGEGS